MSKVNVDEIKVGDLIQRYSEASKKHVLAVVTDIDVNRIQFYGLWSNDYPTRTLWTPNWSITGHWKVINFEEESKVDKLKVYTGKETIEALLEGKTLKVGTIDYRLLGDELQVNFLEGKGWEVSQTDFNNLLSYTMTEVVLPQVGDWVKVTYRSTNNTFIHTAKVNNIEDGKMWADWEGLHRETFYRIHQEGVSWQILTPEQITEYKREQAFSKVGRKLNEFRSGDIVCINVDGGVSVVVSNNNEESVRVHMLNVPGKGYTAKPHQLTPIAFTENQVDLS